MAKISDAEVRRLLSYLKQYADDEKLMEIEDELRGDEAEEFLREPDLLKFFPELSDEFPGAGKNWRMRVIPHAHLRMVQRGIRLSDASAFFRSLINLYAAEDQSVVIGHYALYGPIKPRNLFVTVRIDLDMITDVKGAGHVVTVYTGRGNNQGLIEVDLPIL